MRGATSWRMCMSALWLVSCARAGSSGINGDRQIDSLDTDERLEVCQAAQRYRFGLSDDEITRFSCTTELQGDVLNLPPPGDPATQTKSCEATFNACLASGTSFLTNSTCSSDDIDSPGCTATVAELEDCMQGFGDRLRAIGDQFSCEALIAGETPPGIVPSEIEACKPLASCPGLAFGASGASAESDPDARDDGIPNGGTSATGQLDGVPVASSVGSFSESSGPDAFQLDLELEDNGELWVQASADPASRLPSTVDAVILRVPSSWPHADEYLCADAASLTLQPDGTSQILLEKLSTFGTCPQPGTGTLSLSFGAREPSAVLSLDGNRQTGDVFGFEHDATHARLLCMLGGQNAFVTFSAVSIPTGLTPLPVQNGALVIFPTADDPLLLSCLGADSTIVWPIGDRPDSPIELEGQGLSSLRTCPGDPIDGTLAVVGSDFVP